MNAHLIRITLLTAAFASGACAAESSPVAPAPEAAATTTSATAAGPAQASAPAVTEAMIRARRAEHLKAKVVAKPLNETAAPRTDLPTALAANGSAAVPTVPADTKAENPNDLAKSKSEAADVLPKVEVRRGRVTEIEREVFEQERDIAREKQKTKSTGLDRALNEPNKALKIFGGESTKQRETVAKERVSLMESERDILEAIAYAKTKEQKDELRKELEQIRSLRRDLESALR
jgi:Skp family chaperone for outer membrane proteins